MNLKTKIQLSNLTLSIISIITLFIIVWFVIFLTSTVFKLNVFAEKTTEFYYLTILAALAIILSCSTLNTTLNISIVADSKIKEMKLDQSTRFGKGFYLKHMILFVSIILLLFIGDNLSRSNSKNKLIHESKNLIQRYNSSIDEFPEYLTDLSKIGKLPSVLKFLSNQKTEFPEVSLITVSKFDGQNAYLIISSYDTEKELVKPFYNNSFYKCDSKESEYLENVFNNNLDKIHVISIGSEYRLYYPILNKKQTFVLLFSKHNRYGKLGS